MDQTSEIPESTIHSYVKALNKMPLKIFPIHPGELPKDIDPHRGASCHCHLGNVYQVLSAWGIDVDQEVPWIRPWMLRYQMADGGLNCDSEAYLIKGETPSSMIGTIAAFEAILLYTNRPFSKDEELFLKRGADFLIDRKLMFGSKTRHNAEEREEAKEWLKPCFPRFYFYDVLRGLNALLNWAEKTRERVPSEAIKEVVNYLDARFPSGLIRNERHSYDEVGTLFQTPSGKWLKHQPATFFPLLRKVSKVGEVSPFLTERWAKAKEQLSSNES